MSCVQLTIMIDPYKVERAAGEGGATHTAPSKYHDEIISLVFIHTKYGEPIVIMVFRRAIPLFEPPCRRMTSPPVATWDSLAMEPMTLRSSEIG
jgi:hypothetical protein